jgi:hypothetical protein
MSLACHACPSSGAAAAWCRAPVRAPKNSRKAERCRHPYSQTASNPTQNLPPEWRPFALYRTRYR